ncbi:DUF1778 domain-containing protein [Lonepinella sp. MS14437]|uniref:type II toxin-antitoxin system TacA family antitoxin n=1 Tax=unclassified Lonepinella TaxID=2642006 RepID=UPI0036DDCC7A
MQLAKARLEAKVNPEIYQLLKQAANFSGRTLTDFVVSVAYEQAKKTVAEHHSLQLSLRDQQLLLSHLENETFEPTESMQDAMESYQQYLALRE